jgi:hypothetical protein
MLTSQMSQIPQITSLGLRSSDYYCKNRFTSYHHQLRLIFSLGSQVNSVLEIGIFNSILKELLHLNDYKVSTADVDPNVNPDILLDLSKKFELPENEFDVIVLFQVLEHIPYEQAEQALKLLALFTKKYLVISLPYSTQHLALQLKLSTSPRPRHLFFNLPRFWSTTPICDQHYWEVGLKGYPKKRILNSILEAGLKIKQEFVDPTNPYHYFLVLEKP